MVNESKLNKMMLQLGFTENHLGTELLREAVRIYEPGNSMTKEIYPALARAAHCNTSAIERRIRTAIESAWDRAGMTDEAYEIVGNGCRITSGKPTNSELISLLARRAKSED